MTKLPILFVAAAFGAMPLAAQTIAPQGTDASAAAIRHNATVVAADGRKVGRVDRVRGNQVIVLTQGKLVPIPAATLIADGSRLKTSLTLAEISAR